MKPFNGLTSAQLERLALLSEECGEVVQAIGKIMRHGYGSYHPKDRKMTSNRTLLEKELGDVETAMKLLFESDDIDPHSVDEFQEKKILNVSKYLHHQDEK